MHFKQFSSAAFFRFPNKSAFKRLLARHQTLLHVVQRERDADLGPEAGRSAPDRPEPGTRANAVVLHKLICAEADRRARRPSQRRCRVNKLCFAAHLS